jgi:hypothetical protein
MISSDLIKAWKARSNTSREAVLDELANIQNNWSLGSYDDDTREDAETLDIIIQIIRSCDVP